MSKLALRVAMIVVVSVVGAFSFVHRAAANGEPRVGGPCTYDDYPGTATIVSVNRSNDPTSNRESYVVLFTFEPKEKLDNGRAIDYLENHKESHLQYMGGANPGPAFLKKYHIEPGKKFACTMSVINHGTCSPIVFKFDDIDLKDHDD